MTDGPGTVGVGGGDFFRVTNRDIYDGLKDVERRLTALEYRLDSVLGESVQLRQRIRSLELKSYGIMAGLLGAVVVLLKVGGLPS